MRKRIVIILIVIIGIIIQSGCKHKENVQNNDSFVIHTYRNFIVNDTIIEILNEYIDYLQDTRLIYQVFIEQKPDSTVLFISYTQFRTDLLLYDPIGYFKLNNNLFLLYSGLNKLVKEDSSFMEELKKEINSKIDTTIIALHDEYYLEIVLRNNMNDIKLNNKINKNRYSNILSSLEVDTIF
jgi:hypothetical protein